MPSLLIILSVFIFSLNCRVAYSFHSPIRICTIAGSIVHRCATPQGRDDHINEYNSLDNIIVETRSKETESTKQMTRSTFISLSISVATILLASEASSSSDIGNVQSVKTINSRNSSNTMIETVSGFFSGAAVSTTKTIVKYPLDTASVRLQMPSTSYTLRNLPRLFDGSFRGISVPLIR